MRRLQRRLGELPVRPRVIPELSLNLLPVAGIYTGIEDSRVFYGQSHFAHKLNGWFSHRLSVAWPEQPTDVERISPALRGEQLQ